MAATREKPDIIPGTDVVYKDGTHGEITSPKDLVLIPRPTSDPHDPLVSSWHLTFSHNHCRHVRLTVGKRTGAQHGRP